MKQDYVLRGRGYVDRVGCIMAVCGKVLRMGMASLS